MWPFLVVVSVLVTTYRVVVVFFFLLVVVVVVLLAFVVPAAAFVTSPSVAVVVVVMRATTWAVAIGSFALLTLTGLTGVTVVCAREVPFTPALLPPNTDTEGVSSMLVAVPTVGSEREGSGLATVLSSMLVAVPTVGTNVSVVVGVRARVAPSCCP